MLWNRHTHTLAHIHECTFAAVSMSTHTRVLTYTLCDSTYAILEEAELSGPRTEERLLGAGLGEGLALGVGVDTKKLSEVIKCSRSLHAVVVAT